MSNNDTSSPILGLLLQGDGLHSNNWGDNTNANLQTVENAVKGLLSIALTGNVTLTQAQAAYATLVFTGVGLSGPAAITLPATANKWTFWNKSGQTLTFTLGGAGLQGTLATGLAADFLTDGTDIIDTNGSYKPAIGAIIANTSLTPPNVPNATFMLCAGTALSRTTYATLFGLIGTKYGAGDGVTTFNIPDLNGRALFQDDNGSGRSGMTIGQSGGAKNVVLSISNLPAHNHPMNDPGHSHGASVGDGGHAHGNAAGAGFLYGNDGAGTIGATNGSFYQNIGIANVTASSNSNISVGIAGSGTGVSTQNTGSGTAVTTLPPLGTGAYHIRVL